MLILPWIGALALALPPASPSAEVADLLKQLHTIGPQAEGSAAARAAWEKLVTHGSEVLPAILEAMDTPDTVAANWLRTAFDCVAERALKAGGKKIPVEPLLRFVEDSKRNGRARRLALDLVEQVTPGHRDRLIPGWLDDPEFRYEAVEHLMAQTARLSALETVRTNYRRAFEAARDVEQVKAAAKKLKDFGIDIDVLAHLGFFRDWYVIGPFDAKGMKGFATVYPPEGKIDLEASHAGKSGAVKWKRVTISPDAPGRTGLLSLAQALGDADDAVGYAYTTFHAPGATEVTFGGAADDNLTVWVNGTRVFGFEEYRNGVRMDRHRFKARLQKGVNTILVKVCQGPFDPSGHEPNWEFLLRMVDTTGKGFGFKSALP